MPANRMPTAPYGFAAVEKNSGFPAFLSDTPA
jgi:hypothetical protein